ncbi:hypothetical protein GCM10009689_32930 [Brevibacterium antiquum]
MQKPRVERGIDLAIDRGLLEPQLLGDLLERTSPIVGEHPQDPQVSRTENHLVPMGPSGGIKSHDQIGNPAVSGNWRIAVIPSAFAETPNYSASRA